MNRRVFLQGLAAGAAGLLLPERKVWALDQTMVKPVEYTTSVSGGLVVPSDLFSDWVERLERIDTPFADHILTESALMGELHYNYFQVMEFRWDTPKHIVVPSKTAKQLAQWIEESR